MNHLEKSTWKTPVLKRISRVTSCYFQAAGDFEKGFIDEEEFQALKDDILYFFPAFRFPGRYRGGSVSLFCFAESLLVPNMSHTMNKVSSLFKISDLA